MFGLNKHSIGSLQLSYCFQNSDFRTLLNPIIDKQLNMSSEAEDELFTGTSPKFSFVLVQLLSPLPRVPVPVQFTPYNSLKVFDISKPSGSGVAAVAGLCPQRQLLYQPVRSTGGCADKLLRAAVLVPFGCSDSVKLDLTGILTALRYSSTDLSELL